MFGAIKDFRHAHTLVMVLLSAITLAGCAAHYAPEVVRDPYGFWAGIWHGLVAPLSFLANVVSWGLGLFGVSFLDSVQIIGRPNTGLLWYYVGFVLGLSAYSGGTRQQTRQP